VRPPLRRARDLALLGGDVVERNVAGLDPQLRERAHHPLVQELVAAFKAQAFHQRPWHQQGIGDAVAGLHEHRATARDAAHHVDAVTFAPLLVDLVAVALEGADHDQRLVPVPDAQLDTELVRGGVGGESLKELLVRQGHDHAPSLISAALPEDDPPRS